MTTVEELKAKVEAEHELYLAAHRENMKGAILLMGAESRLSYLTALVGGKKVDRALSSEGCHNDCGALGCWCDAEDIAILRRVLRQARAALALSLKEAPPTLGGES